MNTLIEMVCALLDNREAIEQGDLSGLPFEWEDRYGLCSNLGAFDLTPYFKSWKYFTGNLDYPIPMHLDDLCIYGATSEYDLFEYKYGTDSYGQARWAFIEHLYSQLNS